MTILNWKVLLTTTILIIGIYMFLTYSSCNKAVSELTSEQLADYRTKRYIGIFLIITSVILGVYFYYTGQIKFRANMNNDCQTCRLYIQRHRGLRHYRPEEYTLLKQHSASCKTCSDMCFNHIGLLERNPLSAKPGEVQRVKTECSDTTKYAILAAKELKRVEEKVRAKQVAYWEAVQAVGKKTDWDPFPKVPKEARSALKISKRYQNYTAIV